MGKSLTKAQHEQTYSRIVDFFALLRSEGDGDQIAMHDLGMLVRFSALLNRQEKYFIDALLEVWFKKHFNYNRAAYFVRDKTSGNFFYLTGYEILGLQFFEEGDIYTKSIERLIGQDYLIERALNPRDHDVTLPIYGIDGSIERVLCLDSTINASLYYTLPFQKNLKVLSVCMSEVVQQKLFHDNAYIDQLSGAYRRNYITNAPGEYFSNVTFLAMFDIDHFKDFNTRYGHNVGDQVITTVSTVIKSQFRNCDIVRWGGDEYIMVIKGISDKRILKSRLAQINNILSMKPIPGIPDEGVTISLSIGIEKFSPTLSLESNVDAVNKKMYVAKNSGRARVA